MTEVLASDHAAVVVELNTLASRLHEAESILDAIQKGDVDAVVVSDKAGKTRVYTLENGDRPYQALIEQMQEGAVTLDGNGIILYCNKYLSAMLAVAQERIIGKGLGHFMAPSDAIRFSQMLRDAVATPIRNELDLVAADSRAVPIYLSLSALHRDDEAPLICGVVTDLTEQRSHLRDMTAAANKARVLALERDQQTARLTESEKNFRMLAENANDLIMWVGPAGDRRYLSPAAMRIIGVSPATLIDNGLMSFIHPDDRPALSALNDQLVSGELLQGSLTFRVRHPERGEVWVEKSARSFVDPRTGRSFGYVSVMRDVSDRVQLEKERNDRERELRETNAELDRLARHFAKARTLAEQANLTKTRFLAAMSHELRTPLNGILGYAQLLRMEGGLTELQAQRVQSMLTAGTHLLEMISCVLDLSEIETVGIELQTSTVDIKNLLESCIDILCPIAAAKHLLLRLAITPEVPRRILADPARLRQILLNLLGNAVKFTMHGMVELRLQTLPSGTMLRFEVVDTGPGIPPSQRARLFSEFERLDAKVTDQIEGSGLGLALAKQLTRLMHGRLGHDDNAGGGSVFWLELPLQTDSSAASQPAAPPVLTRPAGPTEFCDHAAAASAQSTVSKRILVVDDVAVNRDIVAAFIQATGYEATCVESGAEAVMAAGAEDFEVILMDVRMPDMDGLEATRRIRALEGPRRHVPIVALTAQIFTQQINACHDAGMDTHLAKPFTLETLLAAIKRGLEAARLRGQSDPLSDPATPAPLPSDRVMGMCPKLLDGDLPVLDPEVFDCTTALLAPASVISHLRALKAKSELLKLALSEPDDDSAHSLAASVHAVGGSAGMFGFKRLVCQAKLFEQARHSDPAWASIVAQSLSDALDASIAELQRRLEA